MRIWMGLAGLALVATPLAARPLQVGDVAPDFSVKTLKGDHLDLASLRGKVVVVNLWATWCVPCRQEFMTFDRYMRLRAKDPLVVIAIETGGSGNSYFGMRKLAEAVSFPVALQSNVKARDYQTIGNAVPTNYVIDRSGHIRYAKAGAFEPMELEALVYPLLLENPPGVTETVAAQATAAAH